MQIFSFLLSSPLLIGIVAITLGILVGLLIGTFLGKPRKNQIFKKIKNEPRGYDLDVIEDTAFHVYAKGIESMPPQRFIKYRPGILVTSKTFLGKLVKITRYIGCDGTAYTQQLQKKGKVEKVSLKETLKTIWGEEQYDLIPEINRKQIEEATVGVTIDLADDPLTPLNPNYDPKNLGSQKRLPTISEEDIKREEDTQAAKTLWQEREKAQRGAIIEKVAWAGFGAGIMLAASIMLGWIPLAVIGG